MYFLRILFLSVMISVLCGCASRIQNTLLLLPPNHLQQRELETRTISTENEDDVLRAAIGLLQDMGYTFEECNQHFGILTASAIRKSDNADAQQVAAILMAALAGLSGQPAQNIAYETTQCILATVVTKKVTNGVQVRVTFARQIFRSDGSSYIQRIISPYIYRLFFYHLDASLFLKGLVLEAPAAL